MVALLGIAPGVLMAQDETYSLSVSLTSFRSWLFPNGPSGTQDKLPAIVNGATLVDSGEVAGTYEGATYDWSQTLALAPHTTTVDFGYDPSVSPTRLENNISVAPLANATVTPGQNFNFAQISFTNGQYFEYAELGVTFTATPLGGGAPVSFSDTIEVESVSTDPIGYNGTTPIYDPVAEADYFYLLHHTTLGSARVYDAFAQPATNPGFVGTITLVTKIGSLDPVAFVDPTGGAFLSPSISPITPVPEPPVALLVGCGLGLMFMSRRRNGDV
jgi:hypothetical protein